MKDSDGKTTYFYCYLCEKQKRQQELLIVSTGRTTALDHLELDHHMNRTSGDEEDEDEM